MSAESVLINEFMAVNDGTLADEEGDFPDWIELHNPTNESVDLDGWYLTDNAADLTGWRIPDVTLEPDEYLVVFASSKNRTDPSGMLHTDFQLDGDGGYLGLVEPDGVTVVQDFGASYIEQDGDISYGLSVDPTLVKPELGELRYVIPTADDAGIDWTAEEFDDSAWNAPDLGSTILVTEIGTGAPDFFELQNVSGKSIDTQGWVAAVNWGTTGDINARHETLLELPDVMAPGEILHVTDVPNENYFGENIFWGSGGPGWVMIVDAQGYASDFVAWGYDEAQIATLNVEVNGFEMRGERAGWGGPGIQADPYQTVMRRTGDLDRGEASEFEHAVTWEDRGVQNSGLTLPFRRETVPGIGFSPPPPAFGGTLDTDVGDEMYRTNASLWLRYPLEVIDRTELDAMTLEIQYNDGFVAYINGHEVARRNAPEQLDWNSPAVASRSVAETLMVDYIDISKHVDVIHSGMNTLAIHALNASVDNGDLFILPDMIGAGITHVERQFAMPTPGEPNTAGYVVINEVHFDPEPTTDKVEFIELFNNTNSPIDLSGWRFDDGVEYTFPEGTLFPARSYLVVGEDPAAMQEKFDVEAHGPWLGGLDNQGERIRLRDASGRVQDEVSYKSTFPWPIASQGEGSSMELIHPELNNDLGGSWRPSGYNALLSGELTDLKDAVQGKPTPGAENSVWSLDEPPQVRQVDHSPNQPATGEPITVTAKVTDFNGVADVSLSYQLVLPGEYVPAWSALPFNTLLNNANRPFDANPAFEDPANWTTVAMVDDGTAGDEVAGDGVYTVVLPAQETNRTLLRYRITGTDRSGTSARMPHLDDPSLNFALYVYDGVPDYAAETRSVLGDGTVHDSEMLASLPVYSLVTDAEDMKVCLGYSGSHRIPKGNEPARDRFNWEGTFVYDGVVYDHVRYRLRQANDRYGGAGKRSMRIRFAKGNYLEARDNYGNPYPEKWRTLNTGKMFDNKDVGNFGLTETLNHNLWNLVGVPSPWMHTFHFRVVDGVDEAPTGANGQYYGDFWGMFLAIEDYDARFIATHDMPDGNLYKLKDGQFNGLDLKRHQGRDAVITDEDFQNIRRNLRPTQSDEWLNQMVDYEKAYWYHAVVEGIRHYDFRPADSHSKNRAWFFEPTEGSPYGQLWTLPWDSDASWGPSWNSGIDYTLNAIQANGGKPEFLQDYRNVLREFRDLIWTEEVINQMIDDLADFVDDFSHADRDRWRGAPADAGTQDFGTLEWKVADMKKFAFSGWTGSSGPNVPAGGRAAHLDGLANAGGDAENLPNTPVITYTGHEGFALDALSFQTSAFSDPQGDDTFAAMQWRIGEISDPTSPLYDPREPRIYEFPAVWQSAQLTAFDDSITIPGSVLEAGHTYRARVRMKDDSGRWGHWSEPVEFVAGDAVGGAGAGLRITEVMYHPTDPTADERLVDPTLTPSDFEFIELQNIADGPIDLTGVYFSAGIVFDFTDSEVTTLEPGQFVVVARNEAAFEVRYGTETVDGTPILVAGQYADARLDNGGERIALADADGQPILSFRYGDSGDWTELADGRGTSLVLIDPTAVPSSEPERTDFLEDGANWRHSGPINGSPGGPDEAIGVVVNEVLTHTVEPVVDAIELHNTTDAAIDIGGWYLSDSGNNYRKFRVPEGTEIPAGGYVYFTEADFNPTPLTPELNHFALSSAHGDDVWLMRVDETGQLTHYVDHVEFGAAAVHETFGRWPDGTGRLYPMTANTLGSENTGPRVGPIVLSEIHYNPTEATDDSALEFVEVYNPTDTAITLTEWRIRGGIDFDFAEGTTIDSQSTLVVVSFDPSDEALADAFRTAYSIDASVALVGPYADKLDNGGETVRLRRPGDPPIDEPLFIPRLLEDEVRYDDEAPWPIEADGTGMSLNRTVADAWGNDAAGWIAAAPTPGKVEFSQAPGYFNGDFDGDGDMDVDDVDALTLVGNLAVGVAVSPADARFDLNGDGIVNGTDLDQWLAAAAIFNGFGSPYRRGDANLDGDVDVWAADGSGDVQTVNTNLDTPDGMAWSDGDFNGDGDVDAWAPDGSGDLQVLSVNRDKNLTSSLHSGGPVDAIHEQAALEDPNASKLSSAAYDWQHEYESTRSKQVKKEAIEATVDLLLATDWSL